MDRPTECKWCGCGETMSDCEALTHFRCGSGYWSGNDNWHRGTNCTDNRDARLTGLKDRIQRAVEALEGAARFDIIPWDGGVSRDPSDGGGEVDADIVDQVIEILKGETDGQAD